MSKCSSEMIGLHADCSLLSDFQKQLSTIFHCFLAFFSVCLTAWFWPSTVWILSPLLFSTLHLLPQETLKNDEKTGQSGFLRFQWFNALLWSERVPGMLMSFVMNFTRWLCCSTIKFSYVLQEQIEAVSCSQWENNAGTHFTPNLSGCSAVWYLHGICWPVEVFFRKSSVFCLSEAPPMHDFHQ